MKKYILLIFACIYAIHLSAQNAGINFLHGTTWTEAVAKAKAENKLIFIDFYTQWCGPCLNMAQTVFSLPTVGYYYNQTFINLKIDAEEGEGITLAKKYGVRSYPTYAFIDPATEEIVHHIVVHFIINNKAVPKAVVLHFHIFFKVVQLLPQADALLRVGQRIL